MRRDSMAQTGEDWLRNAGSKTVLKSKWVRLAKHSGPRVVIFAARGNLLTTSSIARELLFFPQPRSRRRRRRQPPGFSSSNPLRVKSAEKIYGNGFQRLVQNLKPTYPERIALSFQL